MKNNKSFLKKAGIAALIFVAILFIGFLFAKSRGTGKKDIIYEKVQETPAIVDLSAIPEYSGYLYVELNGISVYSGRKSFQPIASYCQVSCR